MSLRFAVLAMLSAGPRTGYDLVRIFDRTVGYVWHAPHSQIYPELRRMEEAGLLASQEERRGTRAVKRTYRLTGAGRDELRRQANEVAPLERERDPVRLKAAYLEFAEPAMARAQLEAHIAHYTEWLTIWEAMADALRRRDESLLQERLAVMASDEHDRIVAAKVFAYEGLIARARMEIEWARGGVRLLRRLDAKHDRQEDDDG